MCCGKVLSELKPGELLHVVALDPGSLSRSQIVVDVSDWESEFGRSFNASLRPVKAETPHMQASNQESSFPR
jgi:hypothetical protein